jgi:hypothetical protein
VRFPKVNGYYFSLFLSYQLDYRGQISKPVAPRVAAVAVANCRSASIYQSTPTIGFYFSPLAQLNDTQEELHVTAATVYLHPLTPIAINPGSQQSKKDQGIHTSIYKKMTVLCVVLPQIQ